MQKEEIVKIVTDLINSKQYDGIWYAIPDELSDEFFSILKNNYPLESMDVPVHGTSVFWFYGEKKLLFSSYAFHITMKFELIPNHKAILIELKERFHP